MLRDLVGRRVGIVRDLLTRAPEAGEPAIWIANAELASCRSFFGRDAASAGGGAGLHAEAAVSSALGEAAERYAAAGQSYWSVETAPVEASQERWRTLIPEGVDDEPGEDWGWARDGCGALVPASLVFMPYKPAEGERVRFVSASTGLAAAPTYAEAVRRGFLELVERDAVARSWYGRCGARRITLESASEDVVAAFKGARVRASLYALDAFGGIPTALAVVECVRASKPLIAVGSASSATWKGASAKALVEAAHSLAYVRFLTEREAGAPEWPPRDYAQHAVWPTHRPADWRSASRFLADAEEGCEPTSADVDALMAAADLHAFDLTTPDLRAVGVSAARVVSPLFLPLSGDDSLRPTRHPRWPRNPNPWPHPMP